MTLDNHQKLDRKKINLL